MFFELIFGRDVYKANVLESQAKKRDIEVLIKRVVASDFEKISGEKMDVGAEKKVQNTYLF